MVRCHGVVVNCILTAYVNVSKTKGEKMVKCPFCKAETKVVETRESEESVRRRRECEKCSRRFTTYERPEVTVMVVKKDGRREPKPGDDHSAGEPKPPVCPREAGPRTHLAFLSVPQNLTCLPRRLKFEDSSACGSRAAGAGRRSPATPRRQGLWAGVGTAISKPGAPAGGRGDR